MIAAQTAPRGSAHLPSPFDASREEVVNAYMPMVRRNVARMKRILPDSVDEGDLMSYGVIGLLESMDRYDASRGVPFEAYVCRRIPGAIVDGIRVMGWLPRAAYRRTKQHAAGIANYEQQLGHTPSSAEMAHQLGLDNEEYDEMARSAAPVSVLSLEDLLPLADEKNSQSDEEEHYQSEMRELLNDAMQCLPARERYVMQLYFYEQKTLKEIADRLNVTEGRICQMKGKALERLREWLREHEV